MARYQSKGIRNRERTHLLNGCSCSEITVTPKNWNKTGASTAKDWFITYRFYDPAVQADPKIKGVKQVFVDGMNEYKLLSERRQITQRLLDQEKELIIEQGYNPITREYMKPAEEISYEISPDLNVIAALEKAREKKEGSDQLLADLKCVITACASAVRILKLSGMKIKDVRRRHILVILGQVAVSKGSKWSNNQFNYFRAHLRILFETLIEWETIENNPLEKIKKKKKVKRIRQTYSSDEHEKIDAHLKANHDRLWAFARIFYYAGCRRSELLRVKTEDVSLEKQVFKALRKKGKDEVEVFYTITDEAVPFWKMMLAGAKTGQYLFCKGLFPGDKPLSNWWMAHMWQKWVKEPLGVEADFYSLKHKRTTIVRKQAGLAIAAAANNESERMIKEHYDVEGPRTKQEELHDVIKSIGVGI